MENNKLSKEQISQILNLLTSNGIKVDLDNKKEDDWTSQLSTNKFGYLSTIMNYRLWLEKGSERYSNKIKYNSFFDYIEYDNDMIKDMEEDYLCLEAEKFFEHNISRQNLKTAFNTYANDNRYNPITDYLDSLKGKWDGTPRLETFIIEALEADDNKMKQQMYTAINEKGFVSLEDMDSDPANKTTLNTVNTYFLGMGLNSDLVTKGLMLKKTLDEEA